MNFNRELIERATKLNKFMKQNNNFIQSAFYQPKMSYKIKRKMKNSK